MLPGKLRGAGRAQQAEALTTVTHCLILKTQSLRGSEASGLAFQHSACLDVNAYDDFGSGTTACYEVTIRGNKNEVARGSVQWKQPTRFSCKLTRPLRAC